MIPSRSSIQVTLEENSGSGSGTARAIYNSINNDNNKVSQVKILRRPKPVACHAQNNDSNTNKNCYNNAEAQFSHQTSSYSSRLANKQLSDNKFEFNDRDDNKLQNNLLLFKPNSNVFTQTHESPPISSEGKPLTKTVEPSSSTNHDEESKIKIFTKNGSSNQFRGLNPSYGNLNRKQDFNIANNNINQQTSLQLNNHEHIQQKASNDNNASLFNNSKHLMKTYQERVDQYAKARLRILGSAFPEDEQDGSLELINNDDVVRILNLNSSLDNNTTVENITATSSSKSNNLTKTNSQPPTYSSVTKANVSHQTIKP